MHINRIPTYTPSLADIMAEVYLCPKDVAKVMQVSERSVYRWLKHNNAPWPVRLALFWFTSYGKSKLDAEMFNRHQVLIYELMNHKEYIRELETVVFALYDANGQQMTK